MPINKATLLLVNICCRTTYMVGIRIKQIFNRNNISFLYKINNNNSKLMYALDKLLPVVLYFITEEQMGKYLNF